MTKRNLIKELNEARILLNIENADIVVIDKNGHFVEKIKRDIVNNYTEYNGKMYFVYTEAENIDGETQPGYCFWLDDGDF